VKIIFNEKDLCEIVDTSEVAPLLFLKSSRLARKETKQHFNLGFTSHRCSTLLHPFIQDTNRSMAKFV
jgi:hypothetical protein